MTTRAPRTAYRRVRVATAIEGPTGPETVLDVRDYGRSVTVVDALGRMWDRTRAADGWWTVVREPCDVCRVPTEERVWSTDRGWWALHAHPADCA